MSEYRGPQPCPWEERCDECVDRFDCPVWLEYRNTVAILSEEQERSNLQNHLQRDFR